MVPVRTRTVDVYNTCVRYASTTPFCLLVVPLFEVCEVAKMVELAPPLTRLAGSTFFRGLSSALFAVVFLFYGSVEIQAIRVVLMRRSANITSSSRLPPHILVRFLEPINTRV